MGDDLPIDIDYAKFLDWLVDRRRVSKTWHTSLKAARVLLRSAADALPEHATVAAPTTYYETIAVLSVLHDKSVEAPFPGSRDVDMLGRYSHPASRAWNSARSSYESGSAYLAEAAQTLVRAADVEAPAIRAEMSRLKDIIAECARREGPTIRAAADAKKRFEDACAEFGIPPDCGLDFEREVRLAVDQEAPALLRKAVAAAKESDVADALAHYERFAEFAACSDVSSDDNSEGAENEASGISSAPRLCQTMSAVLSGDVDTLVRTPKETNGNVEVLGLGGIDWGNLGSVDAGMESGNALGAGNVDAPVNIDWGIEIDSSGAAEEALAGASYGGSADPTDATNAERSAGGIDWGDSAIGAEGIDKGEWQEKDDCDPVDVTMPTLASGETREEYRTDLLQLRAFLVQREAELSRASDSHVSLVLQQFGGIPNDILKVDAADVRRMLSAVEKAVERISGASARRVLNLQCSAEAVRRSARDLSEKMHAATRIEGSIDALAKRKLKASEDLRDLQPKFDALSRSTRETIRQTEARLSTLYKGREVNILGEINVIFTDD